MTELKKEFEEKFKNALYIFETCDECGGNGMDMEDSYKTCGECHGAGKTKRMNPELWQLIAQKIDEACKKQREICADTYTEERGFLAYSQIATKILNAPSPKEI